jgi:hypothetical protein
MKKKIENKRDYSKIDKLVDNLNIKKQYDEKSYIPETFVKEKIKENEIIIKEDKIILPLERKEIIKNIPTATDIDLTEDKANFIQENNKSELINVMEILHSPNNIEGNTILTNPQVIALSVINYLAQVYDVEFYKHFIQLFPRYRISGDDGRGRKELIEIANAIRRDKQEERQQYLDILGRR